jgi:hypothetical protein
MIFLQSTGRSGTSFLRSLLNSHGDLRIELEFLYPDPTVDSRIFYRFWADRIRADIGDLSPNRSHLVFRDYLAQVPGYWPGKIVGLDLKLEQLDLIPWAVPMVYRPGHRFIVLRRINLLRQAVSEAVMLERLRRGDAVVHRDHVPERITVRMDPAATLRQMRSKAALADKYFHLISTQELPHLEVTYEDIAGSNRDDRLRAIQDFLGVEPRPLRSSLAKQTPHRLEDVIENFEALRKAVSRSEFDYTLSLPS